MSGCTRHTGFRSDVLAIADDFIFDSGCGKDLVSIEDAETWSDFHCTVEGLELHSKHFFDLAPLVLHALHRLGCVACLCTAISLAHMCLSHAQC